MKTTQRKNLYLLLNILSKKPVTISEILEEYSRFNIKLSKTTVVNYLKTISANNFELEITDNKNKKEYYLKTPKNTFKINKKDIELLNELKKILIYQKDLKIIRQIMHFYFFLSNYTESEELNYSLLDFGYYSKLNWLILEKLEKHCINKDVIEFSYVIPKGGIQKYTMHVDIIKEDSNNERLYLYGILDKQNKFFQFPLERIISINKVIRHNFNFDIIVPMVICEIKKNKDKEIKSDFINYISGKNNDTIEFPLLDSFDIIQKLLQFCPDIVNISDKNIKNMLIEKLEAILKNYE